MGRCSNLILHCMDYRLQEAIDKWILENKFNGKIDRISIGGPCKDMEFAMKFIKICIEKHGVKNVYLTQHEDCAGYGGHDAFVSRDAEREKLTDDMMDLKANIKLLYPEVRVYTVLMQNDGDEWEMVETDSD
jgi:carbonic anhydrase